VEHTRNILICPLEWGLGHSARMIPLAAGLLEQKHHVYAGGSKECLQFLRSELPLIKCIDFPGFSPRYSKYLPQYLVLIFQLPSLLFCSVREHFRLKKIIEKYKIDIVISDNRFGLWNRKVKTVYVTHQIRIPFPKIFRFLEFAGILLHRAIIRKYTYCFIPDLPGRPNISGRLSHEVRLPGNSIYIGILSRFTAISSHPDESPVSGSHNTVILSGPEPQRSLLSEKLAAIFKDKTPDTVFLGGRPGLVAEMEKSGNIIYINHLKGTALKEVLIQSNQIISRSGYSTLMELVSLKKSALIIPTPGQTEQEYLAEWMKENDWFSPVKQKDLKDPLPETGDHQMPSEEMIVMSRLLLDNALKRLSEDHQE
jgi:hypothetical protein